MSGAPKVVCVGLSKTGTTTFAACMRQLGYSHVGFQRDAVRQWHGGDREGVLARMSGWQSFDDFPWCLAYREIDAAFPGTRFVLTTRRDAPSWHASLVLHARRSGFGTAERRDNAAVREMVYGVADPASDPEGLQSFYARHNAAVRAHFAGRDGALLELCWETGSGWPQLAPFLGHPAPNTPLPHENARVSRPRHELRRAMRLGQRLGRRVLRGLGRWA